MKKQAPRGAQIPLAAEFNFAFNEFVVDSVDNTKKTLGSTVALSTDPGETGLLGPVANTVVFDAIPLPIGAVVTGGEVIVETAYAGSTAVTLSVGVAGATTALANAVDLKTAARTALTLSNTSQLIANDGKNIRLTLAYTVANATAGKVRVRLNFTIDGRQDQALGL